MASQITISMLWPVLALAGVAAFFLYYWSSALPKYGTLAWSAPQKAPLSPMTFSLPCHPMTRVDGLPLVLLTLVYAATAFFQLGSTKAPQTFAKLGDGQPIVLQLTQQIALTKIFYYPGLGTGSYRLEISEDGQTWLTLWPGDNGNFFWAGAEGYEPSYAIEQNYAQLFKWIEVTPDNPQYANYVRITGRAEKDLLNLGELALFDNGQFISGTQLTTGQPLSPLLDEQYCVPERSTYYNSTYFDEIYHARTALEHLEGVYPYEVSHPPLGKLILSVGITLFGMTPFGWRFMGTLFGVLMVPLLYIFLKNLFGRTSVALCGTALFAFDFMHLVQTRIATIDTYAVYFILAAYFFLYRYLTLPAGTPFRRGALPLFLSGLSFGLGAASKWTVLYAGAGLAVLYFIGLFFQVRDWSHEGPTAFGPWLGKTLGLSVLSFVVLPAVIYLLSYLPYTYAQGDMSLSNLVKVVTENQTFMFTYHEGVHDTHPYSSRWYQWLVNGRPILYYLDNAQTTDTGLKTAFGCFNNPLVAWGGLLAILTTTVEMIRLRSGRALFLLVGYLSQLLPWVFIGRTTFAYHYFPSTLFLVIALAFVFDRLATYRPQGWFQPVCVFTGAAVVLYLAFYPVLIGLTVPEWYTTNFLRWLPSWPF